MTRAVLSFHLALIALGLTAVALPGGAAANERHFTYTYESATLPEGAVELEPWTTLRIGRERYYSRFDHRLEFEVGLTDTLQTALYLNFGATAAADASGARSGGFAYQGVSSEWKWRLLDTVADPLGLALYFELTGAPEEVEIEAKVIADKRLGDLLLAANLVFEKPISLEPGEHESEIELKLVLAGGFFLAPNLTLGLELETKTELEGGEMATTVFYGGPTLAYAAEDWWVALSVLPQIAAITGEEEDGGEADDSVRDLLGEEALHARILFGFHL